MSDLHKPSTEAIEKAVANATSSLAIEGLDVPIEIQEVIKKNLAGELTDEEVIDHILGKNRKAP